MRSNPEFEHMINDSRNALSSNYSNDTKPYRQITRMAAECDNLNTAYQMLQLDVYAEKMVQNVRCLLAVERDKKVINNDFNAGELVYMLACTYENCYDRFTPQERKQIESIIMDVLSLYYKNHIIENEETHIFDNHFWQFAFRHFMQAALVMYDKYPLAKEYLEYSYELWTARAPASGFNRDGSWHNGTSYFSANAVTLSYVPTLFSHLTKTDFMQHPWYKNAGIGMLYSWQPLSLSAGFGDGHEKTTANLYASAAPLPTSWHAPPATLTPLGIRLSTTVTKRNPKHVSTAWHAVCNAPDRQNYPQTPPKPYGLRIPAK